MNFGNIGGLLKALSAAQYNLKGTNIAPQQGIAAEMGNLANAQYNTDNPLYQKIYGQEKQAAQQNLAETIAELTRQNRKLSGLGRTPLFDNERGGEQLFRNVTQGYQTAQESARDKARKILQGGQAAQGGVFNTQNTLSGLEDMNRKKQAYGYGNLADIFGAF